MRVTVTGSLAIVLVLGVGSAYAGPGSPVAPVAQAAPAAQAPLRSPDVIFVPTPQEVVDAMLKVAGVKAGDVVYDLGCGDGRTVISAAKLGARGIGIDIDPQRIKESTENVQKSGVGDRVRILNQDLFTSNISDATVVTLYLLPSLNLKLRPKLWTELKPGTRIVSHAFDMGDWKPDQTLNINGRTVYYWVIPPDAAKRAKEQP
jgi:SAM-dependent methyltransferase